MTEVYRPGLKRSWFSLSKIEGNDTADVYLYNNIGMGGVTAEDFIEQVNAVGAKNLNVYVNSRGGEISEGLAIYNFLMRHKGVVTGIVDGECASMASVIMMGCDTVKMPNTATMFLHQPWTIVAGNASQLRQSADTLDTYEAAILAAYTQKTGRTADFISELLRNEDLISAEEAVGLGLADEIVNYDSDEMISYDFAILNKVLCAASRRSIEGKRKSKEINMVDELIEQPAVEPIAQPVAEIPAVEPEQPAVEPVAEPDTVAAKAEPEQIDARAEFRQFVARFGAVRAAAYFAEGLAFADAERRFTDELIAENADLRARNQAVEQVRPVAVQPKDESAKPVEFTRAQIAKMSKSEYAANKDAINKAQAEGRIK